MEPVREGMPNILEQINFCVAEGGSFVLDRADEKLATARRERKESYSALTKQAEEIARSLFASKASETSQVFSTGCMFLRIPSPKNCTSTRPSIFSRHT